MKKDVYKRQEQHGIVKKMKKWIPDTRTYYRHLLDLETDEGKREVIQQKILSIKRTSERDYISDPVSYTHLYLWHGRPWRYRLR